MSKKATNYQNLIQNQSQVQISNKQMIFLFIFFLLLIGSLFLYSSHSKNSIQYILPSKFSAENQTFEKVITFLKSDDTNNIQYEEGFNCVDSAFRLWRNAFWQGLRAYPILIQYEEAPGHMIVAFPTVDKGDIFIETLNDRQIILSVGKNYIGREIRGFYLMDVKWIPLDDSPEFDPEIKME